VDSKTTCFLSRHGKKYRGQGVNEELLKRVNEMTKLKFQQPLASSTSFLTNLCHNWKERGFAELPAMRVWKKLETKGLAYSRPYEDKPRWIMY
jgi:hypothetical protein